DRTDAAVVEGVVRVRVKKRRLQDPGWKNDFVQLGIVIRVHRRRSHAPLAAIDRFVDLIQLAMNIEDRRANRVESVRATVDLQARVIPPFVWITDLDGESGQL